MADIFGLKGLEFPQLLGMILYPSKPHPLVVADRIMMFGRRHVPYICLDLWSKIQKVQNLSDSGRIKPEVFGKSEAGESGGRVQPLLQLVGSLEKPLDRRRTRRLIAPLAAFNRRSLLRTQHPFLSAGSICAAKGGFVQEQNWAIQPRF